MAKTALVKCIKQYHDIELGIVVRKRTEFEVSPERCKALIKNNVCELIEIR